MASSEFPVGIDLGTTFSAIAFLDNEGRPNTITNSEGELTTPSVVFFDHDAVIVGTEAAFAGESDVARLARAAKRDMGGTQYRKTILDRHLPPEVIQSFVLDRLKKDGALKIGEFTKAVVTVPAYFNEPRRKATQDAGELAGLEVIDIINEPTAAALAYGVQRGFLNDKGEAQERELILVYDLGGGTFDVTLMEIDKSNFTAIGTAGDVYLGGIDWDQRIYDFASKEIQAKHEVDFASAPQLREKLMNQCVRAKRSLSARTETVIRLEHEGQRYKVDFDRVQFEDITKDLLERTRMTTDRLLRDADMKWSDLTKLLLVGGSTRMPMVLSMLEKESGLVVDRSLSPDECVAHGAAIYAGILMKHGVGAGEGISISNVNSHDLGVLGIDPKTRKPRRRIVIPRNQSLPTTSSKKFQTSKDGQSKIVVQVVEGGTVQGHGATTIGRCAVTDLPGDIKKGTEVMVTFNYLSSGRLEVLAEIPSLKISADSSIDRSSGMSREQVANWKQKLAMGVAFLEKELRVDSDADDAKRAGNLEPKLKKVVVEEKDKEQSIAFEPVEDEPVDFEPVVSEPTANPQANAETEVSVEAAKPSKATKSGEPKGNVTETKTMPRKATNEKNNANTALEKSASLSAPTIMTEDETKPLVDSFIDLAMEEGAPKKIEEFGEASAVFAFGDEESKEDAGVSILDFLNESVEKTASASGSSLDDFLSELD
jgi:molecular chaperone DnaK